jgi:lycopene cyclase domain-containing protein
MLPAPYEYLTYLVLNIGTVIFPFLLSFDRKVAYFRSWKFLFPAMIAPAALFITWDVIFTLNGVWSFNPRYLTGISIGPLPLEEWLFFVTVPFSCFFIYACLNAYFPWQPSTKTNRLASRILTIALLSVGLLFWDRAYTSVTFIGLSVTLFAYDYWKQSAQLALALRAWAICLIPFLIVNGILTALPVVIYNDNQNLGIRIYTIPFEDVFYGFLLILLNIIIFHSLQSRHIMRQNRSNQRPEMVVLQGKD